jgi:hypothetical protein
VQLCATIIPKAARRCQRLLRANERVVKLLPPARLLLGVPDWRGWLAWRAESNTGCRWQSAAARATSGSPAPSGTRATSATAATHAMGNRR